MPKTVITDTVVKYNNEWEEWHVLAYSYGIRVPECDYHTDDEEDARQTAEVMKEGD